MRRILRSGPPRTEEPQRATPFEIFFDLVFVFALTRIAAYMTRAPSLLTLGRGGLLLLLLWWSWSAYTWLSNQSRADRGVIRTATVVAMAALFVAALVVPDVWQPPAGAVDAPLRLALAYIVVRALQLALYFYVAAGDRRQRLTLLLFGIPTALAWAPLLVGALSGVAARTVAWVAVFLIDTVGGRVASGFSGWRLRSPSHFAERHGLVLIIAIGESLISVGTGAGSAVTRWPVMLAALLGLATAVCLWWLYFDSIAPAAARALAGASGVRRGQIGGDAYSLAHFLLIAGIIYIALGIEQVLAGVSHGRAGRLAGTHLSWAATVTLYGGAVLYLVGRAVFLRLTVRFVAPAQLVAPVVAVLLLPTGRVLPGVVTLALFTGLLIALCGYERVRLGERIADAGEAALA